MNRNPVTSSMPVQVMAVATAFAVTAGVLLGVDALAQHRSVSPYAQVVQLERVVVTGQRLASAPAATVTAAAARSAKKDHCEVAARDAAASTTC